MFPMGGEDCNNCGLGFRVSEPGALDLSFRV